MIQPALLITKDRFPDVYSRIRELVVKIEQEYLKEDAFFETSIYSMLTEIFVLIGRSRTQTTQRFASDEVRQKKYVEKFMDVCSYIDEHCTENLTLDDVASYSGFSKYHFTRLFKQFTGSTFYKYLNQKRITRAERSLSDMSLSVTDVAMTSGFTSMSAFIRMFKIMKGCTPSEFRKMYSPHPGAYSSQPE
jgi:AraC-like DNA-binding protein